MSTGQFTQLSLKAPTPEFSQDIDENELALVSNKSLTTIQSMDEDSKNELKSSFRKARGVLFDTGLNDHGFAMSSKAFKYMEEHFNRTIDTPYLHNFFEDHNFMSVEAMLGRQVKLKYDSKTEQMMYEALLSNKHPLVQRGELMKSVSGTIIRGQLECNQCGDLYSNGWFPEPSCDHIPNGSDVFPVTHKAIHIETSFVTFPAYKKTSVEMFKNSIEKFAKHASFSSVMETEFPDDPKVKEKNDLLNHLSTDQDENISLFNYNKTTKLFGEGMSTDGDLEATRRNELAKMMNDMQKIASLLSKANEAMQTVYPDNGTQELR